MFELLSEERLNISLTLDGFNQKTLTVLSDMPHDIKSPESLIVMHST